MEAGIAANNAEERKRRKYAALAEAYQFGPIAVETMGVYGESIGAIIRAIGRRLVEATGKRREANCMVPSKPSYSCSARGCVQYSLSRS